MSTPARSRSRKPPSMWNCVRGCRGLSIMSAKDRTADRIVATVKEAKNARVLKIVVQEEHHISLRKRWDPEMDPAFLRRRERCKKKLQVRCKSAQRQFGRRTQVLCHMCDELAHDGLCCVARVHWVVSPMLRIRTGLAAAVVPVVAPRTSIPAGSVCWRLVVGLVQS